MSLRVGGNHVVAQRLDGEARAQADGSDVLDRASAEVERGVLDGNQVRSIRQRAEIEGDVGVAPDVEAFAEDRAIAELDHR